jgi:membrane protein involved in colicin uptake
VAALNDVALRLGFSGAPTRSRLEVDASPATRPVEAAALLMAHASVMRGRALERLAAMLRAAKFEAHAWGAAAIRTQADSNTPAAEQPAAAASSDDLFSLIAPLKPGTRGPTARRPRAVQQRRNSGG